VGLRSPAAAVCWPELLSELLCLELRFCCAELARPGLSWAAAVARPALSLRGLLSLEVLKGTEHGVLRAVQPCDGVGEAGDKLAELF
jgi:hypothetical protein